MHRHEDQGGIEKHRNHRDTCDGDVDREDVHHCFLQVIVDPASLSDCRDDGGKVVVKQNKRRCFTCDISSTPPHGNADVSRFKGRSVIHTITGHCDDIAVRLECIDDL